MNNIIADCHHTCELKSVLMKVRKSTYPVTAVTEISYLRYLYHNETYFVLT